MIYVLIILTGPSPIDEIWIDAISNSSVTLEWTHRSPEDHSYEIYITPNYQRIALPIRTAMNKVALNGLIPKNTYIVTVISVYEHALSDPVEMTVTPGVDEPKSVATSDGKTNSWTQKM